MSTSCSIYKKLTFVSKCLNLMGVCTHCHYHICPIWSKDPARTLSMKYGVFNATLLHSCALPGLAWSPIQCAIRYLGSLDPIYHIYPNDVELMPCYLKPTQASCQWVSHGVKFANMVNINCFHAMISSDIFSPQNFSNAKYCYWHPVVKLQYNISLKLAMIL